MPAPPVDFQEHLDWSPRGPGPTTCVLAFASGGQRFEWGRHLRALGVPHVLFRDSTDRWYQGGVAGIGDKRETINYICRLHHQYDSTRLRYSQRTLIALGLSSGAYAALMFGNASGVANIIAISPITGKGDDIKGDFEPHWHHRIEHGPEHPPVPDLKGLLLDRPAVSVKAFVSDGDGTELDRAMAERIGITDITLVPGCSHAGLAARMRDDGTIAELIYGATRS